MQWILSLTPECGPDPVALLARPPEEASLIEIRLDLFPDLDPAAAVAASPLPLLLTLRSEAEGGCGPNDPEARSRLLKKIFLAGPAMIDLEFQHDRALVRDFGLAPERLVLSYHDPGGLPEELDEIASEMLKLPAALVKIITSPTGLDDIGRILRLFSLAGNMGRQAQRRLIAFGMGAVGLPTRFLSPLLGAPIGFASFHRKAAAAPGQKAAKEMEAVCGHLQGPPKRIFGVVGSDVASSLSPMLHAAAYRKLDLPYLCLPLSLPNPADLEQIFRPAGETLFDRLDLPVGGWAVTQPYKELAVGCADFLPPRVRRAGAANTLILKKDRIIAENTDADGVTASLKAAKIPVEGAPVLIQGTGGAARGAAVGMDLAGAEVYLRGRNPLQTGEIAEALEIAVAPDDLSAAILINATPLGSRKEDPLPFTEAEVEQAGAVLDMVYTDTETPLIRLARELGKTTIDGRRMLAFQGIAQFAAFTTRIPPRREMLAALGISES